jgi:hypothetical protein
MKNTGCLDVNVEYDNRRIANTSHTQFLRIPTEDMLYWVRHIDQLLPKLSTAWYAVRVLKVFMTQETLVMVYCGYFHLIMYYGLWNQILG